MTNAETELAARVEAALDQMRPFLHDDGGDVEIVSIDEQQNIVLKLLGSCSSCLMSEMTMKAGIEDAIRKAVPGVGSITALNQLGVPANASK